MSKLLCLALVCSTFCTIVLASNGVFFWRTVHSVPGERETLANFSQLIDQQLQTKTGSFISHVDKYVKGPFTFRVQFDNSYQIRYRLMEISLQGYLLKRFKNTVPFCTFFNGFFRSYMLPMMANHNDFPLFGRSICPVPARTYNIWLIQNRSQLLAPTKLNNSNYIFDFRILKQGREVGGFGGYFKCTKA